MIKFFDLVGENITIDGFGDLEILDYLTIDGEDKLEVKDLEDKTFIIDVDKYWDEVWDLLEKIKSKDNK